MRANGAKIVWKVKAPITTQMELSILDLGKTTNIQALVFTSFPTALSMKANGTTTFCMGLATL